MSEPARDQILIHGIEFEASHGYTAAERKLTRRFRCHIEMTLSLDDAARSDRIQETIDYRRICELAVSIGTRKVFRLLEALAGSIADAIQELHPTVGVTVAVEKLAPPCPGAPAWTGVRLVRAPRR